MIWMYSGLGWRILFPYCGFRVFELLGKTWERLVLSTAEAISNPVRSPEGALLYGVNNFKSFVLCILLGEIW